MYQIRLFTNIAGGSVLEIGNYFLVFENYQTFRSDTI